MFEVGDVVQNTTKSFNRNYPNHTGVIAAVREESNGIFCQVEYTVEVESMSASSRKIAIANGAEDGYSVFTSNTPARSLKEMV